MAEQEYDYIVIGAGSSGSIIASRLVKEAQAKVLLLEAGPLADQYPETLRADGFADAFAQPQVMFDRLSTAQANCGQRRLYTGSGRVTGGSGSVNGMVYTRGDARDFEGWPSAWRWPKVQADFEQLERQLGIQSRPPTPFTERCVQAGLQSGFQAKDGLNDGELEGFLGYQTMNFQGQERSSSYARFLKPLLGDPLLTLLCQAQVQRILFEGKRAAGVRFQHHGITQQVAAKREVIVCAGALETPKLLMLSGIGAAQDLRRWQIPVVLDQPAIGQGLQDHPNVCLFYSANQPLEPFYPQLYGFKRCHQEVSLAPGQPDTCFVFYSACASMRQSLKRLLPMLIAAKGVPVEKLSPWLRKLIDIACALPPMDHFLQRLFGVIAILGKPLSRGEVQLASLDANKPAAINLNYFNDPRDLETLINAVELAVNIANQSPLQTIIKKGLSAPTRNMDRQAIGEWIRKNAMTTFHYCGTCAMGENEQAPVDEQLRVRGVQGLRVGDASAIPEIPVSAINAPTMLIGYRLASAIIEESRHEPNISESALSLSSGSA